MAARVPAALDEPHRPRIWSCCVSAAQAPGLAGGQRRRGPL